MGIFDRWRSRGEKPTDRDPTAVDSPGPILHCELDEAVEPPRIFPTLAAWARADEGAGPPYLPAARFAQKSKMVADGIVAALETASLDPARDPRGPEGFLGALREALVPGGFPSASRPELEAFLRELDRPREPADPDEEFTYKPLGFYDGSPALIQVFQRDRYLQQRRLSPALADGLAHWLIAAPEARRGYEHHLGRVARLAEALSPNFLDLRPRIASREAGREFQPPSHPLTGPLPEVVFPPSTSVENHYSSLADFLRAVRSGEVDLAPTDRAGFHAHQLHTLESLIRPDQAPEAPRRRVGPRYAQALESLGLGILGMGRETQVKQLEVPGPAFAAGTAARRWVNPGLTVEPQPTYYRRTAEAFRFLREVIRDGWGEGALGWRQWRPGGEIPATLEEGIAEIIALGEAAALVSMSELGLAPADPSALASARSLCHGLRENPDGDADLRFMVPLERMGERSLRVLLMLGWVARPLRVSFAVPPTSRDPAVGFASERHPMPVPVTREWIVPRLLSRREFQAIGDRAAGDPDAIAEAVGARPGSVPTLQ